MPNQIRGKKYLTLTEALTLLAFGEAKDTAALRADRAAKNDGLRDLHHRCLNEVAAEPKLYAFPNKLPMQPAEALVAKLENCSECFPPSAEELLKRAREIAGQELRYKQGMDKAKETLSGAAFAGKVGVRARRKSDKSGAFEDVELAYFKRPRTFFEELDKISPISSGSQGDRNWLSWQDVLVEREGVVSLLTTPTTLATVGAEKQCEAWLAEQMNSGPKSKSKTEYRKEAQSLFKVSTRGFGRAWDRAIEKTGKIKWSQRGRIRNTVSIRQ